MSSLPPATEAIDVKVSADAAPYVEEAQTKSPRYTVLDSHTNTVTFMSSLDAPTVPELASEVTEQRFRAHAERWYLDTMPLSSYVEKILHPSYQKILVLGNGVVPLIMNELRDMPNDWFWALRMLTEVDPVPRDQAGDMQAMANAWLSWWENEGSTWQSQNLS